MVKKLKKTITSCFIFDWIPEHAKNNNVSLSNFINVEYPKKYSSLSSSIKRKKKIEEELIQVGEDIKLFIERNKELKRTFTQSEGRFLYTVPGKRRKGFPIQQMLSYFNVEFGRDLTMDEFIFGIDLFEKKAEKTLKAVIDKKRRKR